MELAGDRRTARLLAGTVRGIVDTVVGTEAARFFAKRTGSITLEIDASHAVILSQPRVIANLIRTAIGSLA